MNPLVDVIHTKGIENIDVSMLDAENKKMMLTEAGMILIRRGDCMEGVQALNLAGNTEKLVEVGNDFFEQRHFDLAVLAFEHTGKTEMLNRLGALCIEEELCGYALRAFKAAGNSAMVDFVEKNFLG